MLQLSLIAAENDPAATYLIATLEIDSMTFKTSCCSIEFNPSWPSEPLPQA